MKYLLSDPRGKNRTALMLENIVPAKTAHIFGYGLGVSFSTTKFNWKLTSTFANIRLSGFSDPVVVTQ